ncbi:ATP-binding protein [Streptomyces sp. NPDC001046]|uniref:ATP-binding protein n=1 Tax=Streptomyces sp. NPDC001046 TaxID=3364543 RepID=UPI003691E14F
MPVPLETSRPALVRSVDLANSAQAVRCARRAVSLHLARQGFLKGPDGERSEQAEAALLVVSELVTNACRHTPGPGHLGMALHGGRLVLEVTDRSRTAPRLVPPGDRGPCGGFGLGLVAELVDDWSVISTGQGKTIRVTLPMAV